MNHAFVAIFVFYTALSGSTQLCRDEPDFYRYLAGTIGTKEGERPTFYLNQCDTVIVNQGVTVKVLPNTYISWADPGPNNAIIVYGNLIAQGTKAKTVVFSSSIDTVLFNTDVIKSPWQGITIKSSGSAVFQNVYFHGARIPLTTHSTELSISNSFFLDAERIDLAKGNIIWLNKKKFIEDLDIANYLEKQKQRTIEAEKFANVEALKAKKAEMGARKKRKKRRRILWLGGSALLAGGGAAAWFLMFSNSEPPITEEKFLNEKKNIQSELFEKEE